MVVVAADVQKIITTTVIAATITDLIAIAQEIVDDCLDGQNVSTERSDSIVLYLSAHLVTVTEPRVSSSRSSGHSVSFEGSTGEGLSASKFGQTAKMLDPTGCLAGLDREGKFAFTFSTMSGTEADNRVLGEELRAKFFDERSI